jgi:hypothetical protein
MLRAAPYRARRRVTVCPWMTQSEKKVVAKKWHFCGRNKFFDARYHFVNQLLNPPWSPNSFDIKSVNLWRSHRISAI